MAWARRNINPALHLCFNNFEIQNLFNFVSTDILKQYMWKYINQIEFHEKKISGDRKGRQLFIILQCFARNIKFVFFFCLHFKRRM